MTNFSQKLARLVKLTLVEGKKFNPKAFQKNSVEKETKFVGGKKQIISLTHIELTLSFQMIQFQILKPKEKKAQNLQQQCIQQTQEFNCETTSKEPSSKQKEEKL